MSNINVNNLTPFSGDKVSVSGSFRVSGSILGTGSLTLGNTNTTVAPYDGHITMSGNISASWSGSVHDIGGYSKIQKLKVGNGGYGIDETITMHSESGAFYFENNPTGGASTAAYIYKSPPAGSPGTSNEHDGSINGHTGLYLNNSSFRIANSIGELGNSINLASMSFANSSSVTAIRFQNLPTNAGQAAQIGSGSLWLSGSAADGTSRHLMVFTG